MARKFDVADLVREHATGDSLNVIAKRLGVSPATVSKHAARLHLSVGWQTATAAQSHKSGET